MTKVGHTIFRIGISTLLFYLLTYKISFHDVGILLTRYSFVTIIFVLGLYFIAMFVSALRWRVLIPESRFSTVVRYTFIGQFYALILPGQVTGEIAKAYRFTKKNGSKGSRVTSSILIDKIFGFVAVLLLTLIGLFFSSLPGALQYIYAIGPAFLVLLFVLYFLIFSSVSWRTPPFFLGKIVNTSSTCKRFSLFLHDIVLNGREYAKDSTALWKNFLLGLLFQVLSVMIIHTLAFEQGIRIDPIEWFWIFGVVSVAVILPITFAGLGLREGLFAFFLVQFNVSPEIAVALSLSVLLPQIVGAVIGGLLELTKSESLGKTDVISEAV